MELGCDMSFGDCLMSLQTNEEAYIRAIRNNLRNYPFFLKKRK